MIDLGSYVHNVSNFKREVRKKGVVGEGVGIVGDCFPQFARRVAQHYVKC